MEQHLALYGNVKLPRVKCLKCKRWALVLDGIKQCCDEPIELALTKVRRISHPEVKRKIPLQKEREALLTQFENKCAYCEKTFGSWIEYHGELRKVLIAWDHQIPWVYSQNNHKFNFLPTCRICNGWKSDKIFRDIEEVKVYVATRWEEEKAKEL